MAWYLTQAVGIEAYDSPNNRTLYRTRVYLNASGYNAYSGYSTSGGGTVAGQGFSFTGPSSASLNNSSQEVYTGTFWVYSDTNGYLSGVYADSYFNGSGGYSPGSLSASASAGGVNYDRRPSTPTSLTATVNSDKSITVDVSAVSSPASAAVYHFQYSQNGGAFTGEVTSSSPTYTFTGLTQGQTFQFRAWATNSDGVGDSITSISYFLPAGGRRWDGTSFVSTSISKRFDGTAWVPIQTAKRYNGSAWVDLT